MGRGKHKDRGHGAKRDRYCARTKGEEKRKGGKPTKHKRNVKAYGQKHKEF